jgi:hypothetical protein
VSVSEMADKMADLLREIIDNGQDFWYNKLIC